MAFLCILFLFWVSSSNLYLISGAGAKTVYEVLQEYDFPIGLLPKDVVIGYTLNRSSGDFTVYLEDTCSFSIESYELKYKTTVTGVIAKDKISKLSGISVKVLLLWLDIVEVTRDGDEVRLSVGIASADFPVSNFTESPTCGCGFDCLTGNGEAIATNIKFSPFLASS